MENKRKCSECKKFSEYHREVEGEVFCDDCFNELFFVCDDCGEYLRSADCSSYNTANDNTICQECYDNDYFTCNDCDRVFPTDSGRDVGDYTVCENCIADYGFCDSCETYVESDYTNYCDTCEQSFCDSCWGDHSHNDQRQVSIEHYQGKRPSQVKYKRLVGLEFEAEEGNASELDINDNCGVTDDGSLSSEGIEVQTPPASLSELETYIKEATQGLKDAGFSVNTSCGLHAHLDATDFRDNPRKISKVLKTIYAIEDIIFSIQPASRWNNHYCQRLTRNYAFNDFKVKNLAKLEQRWYKTTDERRIEYCKQEKYDQSRYNGLNLHSLFFRGTLEFRHHAGTLNYQKVLNWVNILLTIVNYGLKHYKEKEIERLLNTPFTPRKLDLFYKIFGIDKDLKEYINSRVSKFNPKYNFYPDTSRTEGD
jgi:hypothetical protein